MSGCSERYGPLRRCPFSLVISGKYSQIRPLHLRATAPQVVQDMVVLRMRVPRCDQLLSGLSGVVRDAVGGWVWVLG